MFDLRYHVASLAAVFIALVIGILVGVGISGRDVIREGQRRSLEAQIARLERDRDAQGRRIEQLEAAEAYERETYTAVMAGRLDGKSIALLFVGPVDGTLRSTVEEALDDSGAEMARLRAVRVPVDALEIQDALAGEPEAPSRLEDLGRALAQELLDGGETPLWDELQRQLVERRFGSTAQPVDGVVLARTVEAQRGPTARLLAGFYNGLASGGLPAVAIERTDAEDSALPVLARYGFSSVDNVETPTGRVSLAVLLEGNQTGRFGVNGDSGYLPRVTPVSPTG